MRTDPGRLASGDIEVDTTDRPPLVAGRAPYVFSMALAIVTVASSLPTFAVPGVLTGPAAMNGSARGTALVMLVLGVPLLIGSQAAARRKLASAVPIWLGAVSYLLYNAFMLLFGTPFNELFLPYVATFSLALWSLVVVLRAVNLGLVVQRTVPSAPRRAISIFCWVVVALNSMAWLRGIAVGLADPRQPAFLEGTGLTTLPTYVQDLAVWMPLMGVAAFWLWRGLEWGHLVVSSILVMWVIESVTIAVDQYLGSIADPTSTVTSASMSPVFAVLAVITTVPTVLLLRRM